MSFELAGKANDLRRLNQHFMVPSALFRKANYEGTVLMRQAISL
jgi:hypothetical protein